MRNHFSAGEPPQNRCVAIVNPDEMETQLPGLPDVDAPMVLGAVVAALHLRPPSIDPRCQHKANFKAIVDASKQRHCAGFCAQWQA